MSHDLKFWIEHYDKINEARWGDDDKEPPTWEEVRAEHLSDWCVGGENMTWEYWHAYVTGMIIECARESVLEIADLKDSNARLADALKAVKERLGED